MNNFYYIIYVAILAYSLYDIWTGKLDQGKKILWTLLCIILGVIGTAIYFIVGRKK